MKSEEYIQKVRHLEWLKGIAKDYRSHAETLKKHPFEVTVQAVVYTIKGSSYRIETNPHRPIQARYIYGGLTAVIEDLDKEIKVAEDELKSVIVQL